MKKLYTSTLMLLMFALCILNFSACQEFNIDSQPEGPLNIQIDAQDTYTALATSPSNIVFNVSSNTPWTITSDQQWCKVTPAMSAASSLVSEIVVTLENNEGKQSRTAKLTITADGVVGSKVITIEQASKEDLVVIPYDEIVPTDGGQISFNIVSNKPWEIIPSTQFVENMDKTSGEGNENGEKETITITIPKNTGAVRTAEITVKTAFQTKTFTITQDGIIIEPKNKEEATNKLAGMGGEKTIEINSSVEWKVEIPAEYKEWLSAEADGNNLKLVAKFNNLFITRVGHVLLYPKTNVPGFEGVPVEVTQSRNVTTQGIAEVIDPATGYATIQSTGKSRFITNFKLKKGKIVWELDKVDMPSADAYFDINGDTWWCTPDGAGWMHAWLRPASSATKSELKSQWDWTETAFKLEDINSTKTVTLEVKDDPDHIGKICIILSVNGQEVTRHSNKTDIYSTNPPLHKGHEVYFGFEGPAEPTCTLTFKTVNFYPAE